MIVLDTNPLSVRFRRPSPRRAAPSADPAEALRESVRRRLIATLNRLVRSSEDLLLPGIVYQEVLSGFRDDRARARVRGELLRFEIGLADAHDHDLAVDLHDRCAARGVAVSHVDALIGAIALRENAPVLTADGDFLRMASACGVPLAPLDPDPGR